MREWLEQTVERIRERFPQLLDPPSDDICYATQNRQQAVKKISDGADLVPGEVAEPFAPVVARLAGS